MFITESAYIYVKVGLCWNCFMQFIYSLFILIERFSQHLNESRNHSGCSWFTWISNKASQEEEEWLDMIQWYTPRHSQLSSPHIEYEGLCFADCNVLTWVELTVIRLVGNSFLTGPVCLHSVDHLLLCSLTRLDRARLLLWAHYRVEHSHWSGSSRYSPLIGWALLCWC